MSRGVLERDLQRVAAHTFALPACGVAGAGWRSGRRDLAGANGFEVEVRTLGWHDGCGCLSFV